MFAEEAHKKDRSSSHNDVANEAEDDEAVGRIGERGADHVGHEKDGNKDRFAVKKSVHGDEDIFVCAERFKMPEHRDYFSISSCC